jgi:hypothetical protein
MLLCRRAAGRKSPYELEYTPKVSHLQPNWLVGAEIGHPKNTLSSIQAGTADRGVRNRGRPRANHSLSG